ncbi:MAG: hypothetical protein JNL24_05855 [Bacteroidia bacterium]|jgi:hypothetical protein|nr:hypothetical protein [Bacteroidia bacterium]
MRIIIIILIALFVISPIVGFSQKDSSGIYFTVKDYTNQKLTFAINCKNEKHKIKVDMIFHQKEISIKHNDSTYKYPKDSVYGIKYCDGSVVRIFKNSEFLMINAGETILLYKVEKGSGMKNDPVVTNYYFSKDAESEIQKLTINNLKSAVPFNHKFHDLLDMEFHNDNELIKYDSFHKITRINKIYLNSLIGKEK